MDQLFSSATIAGVSIGITKIVDWIRTRFDREDRAPKDLWIAVALALGIAFSVRTGFNVLNGVLWAADLSQIEGQVATGVLLGGGAAVGHEGLDFLSGVAKAKHAIAAKTNMEAYRPPAPEDEETFE